MTDTILLDSKDDSNTKIKKIFDDDKEAQIIVNNEMLDDVEAPKDGQPVVQLGKVKLFLIMVGYVIS